MKSQQKNINVEVDWDQLDTFFVDQYEADYGKYFSTTVTSYFKSQIKSD